MIKSSKTYLKNIASAFAALTVVVAFAGGLLAFAPAVYAADPEEEKGKTPICTDTNGDKKIDIKDLDPQKPCQFSDKLENTPDGAAKACSGGDCSGLIKNYINPLIKVLSGLFGVIATISLIAGGIQISSAGGDPGKVAAGRKRIYGTIIAILAYLFMFAFLNWLLPGGIV